MKKTLLTLVWACCAALSFAQLNMTLLDSKDYSQDLNDIWGWVDPDDSTEYALVGTVTGTSVVSLADPQNIVEVAFFPGDNSTWRDIKTWGHFAYVTADNGNNDGLLVIDLSGAPANITASFYAPNLPGLGQYERSHNIYIDEFGYAYLAGSNINNGGMLIVDVFTTPGSPQFVAAAPAVYSHDVYVRDNRMYASEIYEGQFAVYDVSNKNSIQLLATQLTPFQFTHNTWLNDDGNVLFTTDEQGNAPIGSYDISDLDNIVELDQFIPISTMGANVIPHNVHVWQDWLIISYYTDGGVIVDASKPDNLIEVGNWDTFLGGNGGFSGAWGAYPFLPSGIVLLTDIGNGLFVCGANYVRACWLEGTVTNAVTGANIFGAQVEMLDSPQANFATTGLNGHYETGQAISGTFDVTFSANGYYPKTVPATLENGELTILNVALDPIISYTLAGQTIKSSNSAPLPGTKILLQNGQGNFEITSDANGNFTLANVFEGEYTLYAGAWGYEYTVINNFVVDAATPQPLVIALDKGAYKDDFILDYNWIISGSAGSGQWERGEPKGTVFEGKTSNPEVDVVSDLGDFCYVTGNDGGDAGTDDVDNGVVTLTSPVMSLGNFNDPVLSYSSWFFNDGGNGTPNDFFVISVTNGSDEVILETISTSNSNWNPSSEFHLADLITLTDNMQVIFETSDLPGSGHLVEAAVDAFLVQENCFGPEVSFAFEEAGATITFTNNSTGGTAVEWDFGDNTTSNEENPVHTYAGPGEYEVTLTVTHDCGFSVYTQTITVSASSTIDLDENGYALVATPNPFAGQVFVKYELKESYRDASLSVFDVLGQQVATALLSANNGTVAFGDELSGSGVYFLRLVVDGKVGKAVRMVKL